MLTASFTMVAHVSVCPVRCLPCMCMVSCRSPLKIVSQSFSCYFPTLSPTLLSCMTQCTIMLLVGIVSITYLIRSFFNDMFLFYPRKQSLVRGMLESVGWPVWLVVLWSDLLEYIMLQVCRANVFHISNMQLALNLSHENYKKCKHTRHIFELFDQRITALFHLEHSHIMSVHVQLFDVS